MFVSPSHTNGAPVSIHFLYAVLLQVLASFVFGPLPSHTTLAQYTLRVVWRKLSHLLLQPVPIMTGRAQNRPAASAGVLSSSSCRALLLLCSPRP